MFILRNACKINGVLKHMSKAETREFWLRTDNRIDRPKEKREKESSCWPKINITKVKQNVFSE